MIEKKIIEVYLFLHARYFVGDIVIVRAIKGIEKGDMIAENYGPIFTIKVRDARKRILKERYWFDCCCRPCSEDWPIYTQIDDGALKFRCTTAKCRKPLQVSTDTESPFVLCSHCKKSINILKVTHSNITSLTYTPLHARQGASPSALPNRRSEFHR